MRPIDFDWTGYIDDCPSNVFKSYVRGVKHIFQLTGLPPIGAKPPSPKAQEWLDEFLERNKFKGQSSGEVI